MKKLTIFLLLTFSFICYSQETYTMKSGGRIFNSKGEKLTTSQVENAFKNNPTALGLYTAGRDKKTIGNVLLWGGLTTFIGKFMYNTFVPYTTNVTVNQGGYPTVTSEERDNLLYYVGAAMVAVSIPVKIGFERKIKKSVELMNESSKSDKASIESANLLVNSKGVGFSITF